MVFQLVQDVLLHIYLPGLIIIPVLHVQNIQVYLLPTKMLLNFMLTMFLSQEKVIPRGKSQKNVLIQVQSM